LVVDLTRITTPFWLRIVVTSAPVARTVAAFIRVRIISRISRLMRRSRHAVESASRAIAGIQSAAARAASRQRSVGVRSEFGHCHRAAAATVEPETEGKD
jgi:hypothetical protein